MSNKWKFLLLALFALVGLFVLLWLSNLCAYHFWLAGQNIKGREVHERQMYWFLAFFMLALGIEALAIWRAARLLKRGLKDEIEEL